MIICRHRVNSEEELARTQKKFGVEVDIRSNGNSIILAHDPFVEGPTFQSWLRGYAHRFLIVNLKEEGLEDDVAKMLAAQNVRRWAFLDQSFPFLMKGLRHGRWKSMVRVSDFEHFQTALSLRPRPEWVWLDSFQPFTASERALQQISGAGYKIMVVSPELQGREPGEEIATIQRTFASAGLKVDGVCTKEPLMWAM